MVPLIQYLAIPVDLVFWSIDKGTPAPIALDVLREHILSAKVTNAENVATEVLGMVGKPLPNHALRWHVQHRTAERVFHVDTLAVLNASGGKA
jgi:hypothetical protein